MLAMKVFIEHQRNATITRTDKSVKWSRCTVPSMRTTGGEMNVKDRASSKWPRRRQKLQPTTRNYYIIPGSGDHFSTLPRLACVFILLPKMHSRSSRWPLVVNASRFFMRSWLTTASRSGNWNLLFNDTQTFHSDLKKEVAKNLRVNYNIQPLPNAVKENEQQTEIKKQANKLLSTAAYLWGDGKASNFAHLGLQRPCLSFFYSNSKKVLHQFPEFQPHVPYKALALVAAIVYGLLDALRKYGDDKLAFENTSWSTIQDAQQEFLQRLDELCAHEYHGPKLNAMLEDWAKLGMMGYKTNVSVTTCARNEFAMVLD
ncbi:hypothetical protein JVT61DRAFT_14897 [Boletus reticuloceps]|uniref:DUF6532 domain-containing protein n=1 Tax=Boletus reticuloceps TaxID=495285 RepID=A0A8I2YCL6_9AGAM|nr:hypothetical protein JVT61DRAFT_14897 [Boletus reticuloceps]